MLHCTVRHSSKASGVWEYEGSTKSVSWIASRRGGMVWKYLDSGMQHLGDGKIDGISKN